MMHSGTGSDRAGADRADDDAEAKDRANIDAEAEEQGHGQGRTGAEEQHHGTNVQEVVLWGLNVLRSKEDVIAATGMCQLPHFGLPTRFNVRAQYFVLPDTYDLKMVDEAGITNMENRLRARGYTRMNVTETAAYYADFIDKEQIYIEYMCGTFYTDDPTHCTLCRVEFFSGPAPVPIYFCMICGAGKCGVCPGTQCQHARESRDWILRIDNYYQYFTATCDLCVVSHPFGIHTADYTVHGNFVPGIFETDVCYYSFRNWIDPNDPASRIGDHPRVKHDSINIPIDSAVWRQGSIFDWVPLFYDHQEYPRRSMIMYNANPRAAKFGWYARGSKESEPWRPNYLRLNLWSQSPSLQQLSVLAE